MERAGRGRAGFTTLEMAACFFIIALIAGLMGLRMDSILKEAMIVKARADLRTLAVAFQFFRQDHGQSWPHSIDDDFERYQPQWLDKIPRDPFNDGRGYGYQRSAYGHYVLWSVGPGGQGRIVSFDEVKGVRAVGNIICISDLPQAADIGCMVL